jgi:hypothetical protein
VAIRYIKQKDINYTLWDRCINNSINGAVFAYSWYLNIAAEHWDALVENDYRSVMPLVYRKSFFFKEIFTPLLTRQLGIFSEKPINSDKIDKFLKAIPNSFKKIDIFFNRQNTQSLKSYPQKMSVIYELDLIMPYEKKKNFYSTIVKESISLALEKKLKVRKGVALSDFEAFIRENIHEISLNNLINPLHNILQHLLHIRNAEILGVYSDKNVLYAAACFIRSNHDVVLLYACSGRQGIQEKANYLLFDSFLESYSTRNVTLSIEHIDKNWNGEFYNGFGAIESNFCCFSQNRLPFFLKWT